MSRRIIFASLFAVIAVVLLLAPLPNANSYASRIIENAGHTPLFLVATLFLLSILRHDFGVVGTRRYVLAAVLGSGAGLLSEIVQRTFRRDASWEDVFADALGVALALALSASFERRATPARGLRWVTAAVAIACAAIYVAPIAVMSRAYLHRNGQFPVLADFSSPQELTWIVGYGINREMRRGALDVEFVADEFPGLSLFEPMPDWRHYRSLVVEVENPANRSFALGVRVHDRGHGHHYVDRFNKHYAIAPGERTVVRIPLDEIAHAPRGRSMDMAQIADVTLYRGDDTGSRELRVYSLRLE